MIDEKIYHREYMRRWRAENPDREFAYVHKRRSEKKKEITAYQRVYRLKHLERAREQGRRRAERFRQNNPNKITEMTRKYYVNFGSVILARNRKWIKGHPLAAIVKSQNRRLRFAQVKRTLTTREWAIIVNNYDGRCAYCGRGEVKMTMDHIIPISKGGEHTANNVVPACKPCNSRKRNNIWRPFNPSESILAA